MDKSWSQDINLFNCVGECFNTPFRFQVAAQMKTDNLMTKCISDQAQVAKSTTNDNLGDVWHPELIDCIGNKTFNQIGVFSPIMVWICGNGFSSADLNQKYTISQKVKKCISANFDGMAL